MYCNCGKMFKECQCPDIDARLEKLKQAPNLLTRWCEVCGKHADRCACQGGPKVVHYSGGVQVHYDANGKFTQRKPDAKPSTRSDADAYAAVQALADQAEMALRSVIAKHLDRFERLAGSGEPVDEVDRNLIRMALNATVGNFRLWRSQQGINE